LTGYGVLEEQSWFRLVANESKQQLVNKAIDGNTTTDVLVRFHEDAVHEKPDFIFIMAGTNDALNKRTANIIFNNVVEMINISIDNGIVPIIILQPLPYVSMANEIWGQHGEDYQDALNILKRYRRLIKDYCQDESIDFVDFDMVIPELDTEEDASRYFKDGIHLTSCAHALVAEKFIERFGYLLIKKSPEDYFVS
jgi:lysophospholipase L1-like esterase